MWRFQPTIIFEKIETKKYMKNSLYFINQFEGTLNTYSISNRNLSLGTRLKDELTFIITFGSWLLLFVTKSSTSVSFEVLLDIYKRQLYFSFYTMASIRVLAALIVALSSVVSGQKTTQEIEVRWEREGGIISNYEN